MVLCAFGVGLSGGQNLGTVPGDGNGCLADGVIGEEIYVGACFCTVGRVL